MDTKWKGWTAISAVKALSVLALIALFLAVVNVVILMAFGFLSENRALLFLTVVAAVAPVPLIVLLLGAGRSRKSENNEVRLRGFDRLYLDIGLCLIFPWTVFVAHFLLDVMHFYGMDVFTTSAVFSVGTLFVVIPLLLWLTSFVKHLKAGRFWEHTLIFVLLKRILRLLGRVGRFIINTAKSLWAGASLTRKVGLISAAVLFLLLFTAAMGAVNHPFPIFLTILAATAAVAYLLFRYARRIYELDEYAQAVSAGVYGMELDIGQGELGSIANSIDNMSAGIHRAVEERLKSERLKTELITNVSHDIRTPLTSIITYTDLLKQEGLICEKAPEYLDVLVQKSQRLKTLTDELFEAAKAATGNIEVNITELDFVSLINQVLGELDGAIQSSGLDLRVNLPERLYVFADGKLMWRVMENLLSNVFKYALPGSRVYLDVRQAGPDVFLDLKNISAVELNIDPSELTERFKRGDDSRTDGGSGLGLSIVQSFVAAQGGTFTISIDGDLFKVTVRLPAV